MSFKYPNKNFDTCKNTHLENSKLFKCSRLIGMHFGVEVNKNAHELEPNTWLSASYETHSLDSHR